MGLHGRAAHYWRNKIGETKVPVLVTWPGSPMKDKLGTQPFSVDIPFGVKVVNGTSAELVPAAAQMNLGGQYVEITMSSSAR